MINEHKKEYIDKEGYRILNLLEESLEEGKNNDSFKGSLEHQIPLDWSDKIIDAPYTTSSKFLNKTIEIKECYKGKCIGFNKENHKEFQKLITNIYKEREISLRVTREFIEQVTFKWLIKTYKTQQAENNLSVFLLDEILVAIEEVKVHFSILHLDIAQSFEIGKVKFEYFTKEYFDTLSKRFNDNNPNAKENPYESMREEYQGKVYATYIVKAEREKGKEIAFEECALAVDILKMCSDTTDFPQLKLSFDIDSRIKESLKNEVILTGPKALDDILDIGFIRNPSHHKITNKEWSRLTSRNLGYFHNFLLSLQKPPTELEQLIINGIKRYSNALSNPNLHQRILELFTILESLLLLNNNSPIIESVSKYSSKLVFKKPEDRLSLIELLKTMYKVRSSYIHHAKELEFKIDNLRKLQITVLMLFTSLIKKREQHKTKESLLNEIDDAILNAY